MTTPHPPARPPSWLAVLGGLLLGALPGLVLVGIAQWVIDGEQQLTVGTGGMWLALLGGIAGAVGAVRRARKAPGR